MTKSTPTIAVDDSRIQPPADNGMCTYWLQVRRQPWPALAPPCSSQRCSSQPLARPPRSRSPRSWPPRVLRRPATRRTWQRRPRQQPPPHPPPRPSTPPTSPQRPRSAPAPVPWRRRASPRRPLCSAAARCAVAAAEPPQRDFCIVHDMPTMQHLTHQISQLLLAGCNALQACSRHGHGTNV